MGAQIVFWNTEFPGATAHLTYGGSLPGEAGARKPTTWRGKKRFAKEKVVLFLDVINGPVWSIHFFSFKEKGAIASYTLRNVIQSFLFILRKSSEKPESYF